MVLGARVAAADGVTFLALGAGLYLPAAVVSVLVGAARAIPAAGARARAAADLVAADGAAAIAVVRVARLGAAGEAVVGA